MDKGQYGVANKAEELRGKVAGLYIDRNITLTKELSEDEINSKIKNIFPDRASFMAGQEDMANDMFGETLDEDDKPKKKN
jgi:hypothetical protein